MSLQEQKVEFLKVWYSVFCTLMDAWADGEYTDLLLIAKLNTLRNSLTTRMPEVEAELLSKRAAKGEKELVDKDKELEIAKRLEDKRSTETKGQERVYNICPYQGCLNRIENGKVQPLAEAKGQEGMPPKCGLMHEANQGDSCLYCRKPKVWWEYIGEELAIFWESPFGHGKEKIASFWWPTHPMEATAEVEFAFERIADQLTAQPTPDLPVSSKPRCTCDYTTADQCPRHNHAIKPWLYAIEERNEVGETSWKDGEQCVFGDRESAQDEVDTLNDSFPEGDNPFSVVPLYKLPVSSQPSERRRRRSEWESRCSLPSINCTNP